MSQRGAQPLPPGHAAGIRGHVGEARVVEAARWPMTDVSFDGDVVAAVGVMDGSVGEDLTLLRAKWRDEAHGDQ